MNMAEARLRAGAQVSGQVRGQVSAEERRNTPLLPSEEKQLFVLRLFSAGFYGFSSFLIVVLNKSVLSSYR